MGLLSRVKTWVTGEVLTASDLNSEFNNILNNMDCTKIDDDSSNVAAMQATVDPGESGSESLATSLQGELERLRFIIKEITGKTYWYQSPAVGLNVLSANSSLGAETTVNTTATTDTTVLTGAAITTRGRPVAIRLVPSDPATYTTYMSLTVGSAATSVGVYLTLRRDSTVIDVTTLSVGGASSSALALVVPASSYSFVDNAPSAGTYTYSMSAQLIVNGVTSTFIINRVKLAAIEM
jgi:hypothetical protein